LHRIAINVAHSYRARQKLREVGEVVRRLGPPREGRSPEDVAADNDVIRLVSSLPIKHSAVLVLRHYHGYSNREIAQILGIPERTVASRLARAKRRLRNAVEGLPGTAEGAAE
jgi:RNA polymerase sigma-70 factor (ECF subfamily)